MASSFNPKLARSSRAKGERAKANQSRLELIFFQTLCRSCPSNCPSQRGEPTLFGLRARRAMIPQSCVGPRPSLRCGESSKLGNRLIMGNERASKRKRERVSDSKQADHFPLGRIPARRSLLVDNFLAELRKQLHVEMICCRSAKPASERADKQTLGPLETIVPLLGRKPNGAC